MTIADERKTAADGQTVRKGLAWNTVSFAVSQGFGLAVLLILTQRLEPSVYGVFALSLVLIDYVALTAKSSAVDAVVQSQADDAQATSTYFWSFMGLCVAFVVACVLVARPMAEAFSAPDVAVVLPMLALTVLTTPFIVAMEARLLRDLRFKSVAFRNMIVAIASGAAGIAAAYGPAPEWALVLMRATQSTVGVIALYGATRWLPAFAFEPATARAFGVVAARLFIAQAVTATIGRIGDAAIGWRFGADALGQTRIAMRFVETLHSAVTTPIQNLWVPMLTRLRGDPHQARTLFVNLSLLSNVAIMPAFVGLALVGPDLAALLLPPMYPLAGPILGLAFLLSVSVPLGYFRGAVLVGMGQSKLALRMALGELVAFAILCAIAIQFDDLLIFVALSVVPSIGFAFLWLWLASRLFKLSAGDLIATIAPGVSATTAMALAVSGASVLLADAHPGVRVAAMAAVGLASYGAWLFFIHREEVRSLTKFLANRKVDPVQPEEQRS